MNRARQAVGVRGGFTLVELMTALFLSSIIVVAVLFLYHSDQRALFVQRARSGILQNTRTAMDLVAADLRMGGYGMPIDDSLVSFWVPWVSALTSAVTIVDSTNSTPDELYVVTAENGPAGALQFAASVNDVLVTVESGQGSRFVNPDHDVLVYIGRTELARVISVSGDDLTLSTHPTVSGVGLTRDYSAGAPLETVEVVRYYCELSPSVSSLMTDPYLARQVITNSTQADTYFEAVCTGIEDLQLTVSTNLVTIVMTGRAQWPDSTYTHPVEGDAFRRESVRSAVGWRN